jgi:hypothetical protein
MIRSMHRCAATLPCSRDTPMPTGTVGAPCMRIGTTIRPIRRTP